MVHAAVHSARTTLSGPREKGTFVSTQLVHYFVRIDGILGPWRRIDRSASSPGVTACDAVFAHVQQVASGTPHSASLSPRSTSDIDSYACDAVRCSGAANRSANGRRGMGGRTWRRHNRLWHRSGRLDTPSRASIRPRAAEDDALACVLSAHLAATRRLCTVQSVQLQLMSGCLCRAAAPTHGAWRQHPLHGVGGGGDRRRRWRRLQWPRQRLV